MTTDRILSGVTMLLALAALPSCSDDSSAGSSCGGFSPCGGNIDGTWQVDAVCIDGDLVGALNGQLSSLPPACWSVFKTASIDATGTVDYSSNVETANIALVGLYTAVYSKECLSAIAGATVTATAAMCSSVESGITGEPGMSATCPVVDAGCSCAVSQQLTNGTEADGYSIDGSTLVYSSGNDPAEFCVHGDTLTERSTNADLGIAINITAHRVP